MAHGPRYSVRFRRRREGRTDYKKRLAYLKYGLTRLVIRKSNKYILFQVIRYSPSGDKISLTVNSNQLVKFGWKHSCRNSPAAYLTGLLAGKLAKDEKVTKAVIDFGLQSITKGSILFAALKGIVDTGIEVSHSPDMFPTEDRLMGKNLKKDISKDVIAIKDKVLKAKAVRKKQ